MIYASSPVCRVVGEFSVDEVLDLALEPLWAQTASGAGIERSYFDSYFDGRETGYAIRVGRAKRYRIPRCLHQDLGVKHAPQSFCYLPD